MQADPAIAAMAAFSRVTGPGGECEVAEEDVLGVRMRVFRNRHRNLGEVLALSAGFGDRDYLVTAADRLSFTGHAQAVASLVTALREDYGVQPGDRIAINAANDPGWIVSFWAAVALGAITVGCNAWWTQPETQYALGHTRPVVVIADARRAPLSAGGAPVLTLEEDIPRLSRQHPSAPLAPYEAAEDDPTIILFTSGTAGRPKGAVHSHRNLTSVIEWHRMNEAIARELGDRSSPAQRRYLLALPLFHIAGLHNLAIPRLATGTTAVLYQGAFDPDRVLRLIEQERVSSWGVVPTMAHRLVKHGELSRYDLSSLTQMSLATAPSSLALKEALRDAVPAARRVLSESYGLTESSTAITIATAADLAEAPGTVGRPIPTVEVEIRDAEGTVLPEGQEGEICARSAFNMLRYWDDPEASSRTIPPDRWLRTGDIGMLKGGRLFLTTRRSDLIIRGGENVYPAEIENVLSGHPGVAECIIIGLPHADLGQEVAAVVVTDPEHPVSQEELRDYATERLAYFKVPARWRLTDQPLPRNATGKVIRQDVRQSFS
jgi:steroid-24-oyl-CoA synthetase